MKAQVSFQDVLNAWPIVRRYLHVTPLYRYPLLSARLGFDAFVKHENHLPIGAFKVRGGINYFSQLTDSERAHGVITATRGNHGQSIAYAARTFGSRAVIYVPEGNNPEKNANMEALGAQVIVHGKDFDEARHEAEACARNDRFRYVHPANEPLLVAGVGTASLEIMQQLPEVDAVIVPMGGGSCAAGAVLTFRAMRPEVSIIGVQAAGAPALAQSLQKGQPTLLPSADTFADGLATRAAYDLTFDVLKDNLDEIVLVSEEELKEGVRLALETTHNLAEGASAAAYAAADKLRQKLAKKRVVLMHTGQNIDRNTLRWALGMFDA